MGLNTGGGTRKQTGTTKTAANFYNPAWIDTAYGTYQNRLGQTDYLKNLILGGKGYTTPAPGTSINPAFLTWLSQNFGRLTGGTTTGRTGGTTGGTTTGGTGLGPRNQGGGYGSYPGNVDPSQKPTPPGFAYARANVPTQDDGGYTPPAGPVTGARPTGGGTTGGSPVTVRPDGTKIARLPGPTFTPYTPGGDGTDWVTDEPTGRQVLPPGTPITGTVTPGANPTPTIPGGTTSSGGEDWLSTMPDPFLQSSGGGKEADPSGGLLGSLFGLLNSPVSDEEKEATRQSSAAALQAQADSQKADMARRAAISGNSAALPGAMAELGAKTSAAAGEMERQNEIKWADEAERRKELAMAGLQGLYGVESATNLATLGQNLNLSTLRAGQTTDESGTQDWSQQGAEGTLSGDFFGNILKALGLGKGTGTGTGTSGGGTTGAGARNPDGSPKGGPDASGRKPGQQGYGQIPLGGVPGYDENGNPFGENIPEGWSENTDLGPGYYTDDQGNTFAWDTDYGYIPMQFDETYGWIPDQGVEGWPDEWYIPSGDTGGDWWTQPGGEDWGGYWDPYTGSGDVGDYFWDDSGV